MQAAQRLEFETEDRKRIYGRVERNGTVTREERGDELTMDSEQIDRELSILERDGYLEEQDGRLRIAVDTGTEVEYETDEFEYTVRPARQADLTGIVGVMRQVAEEKDYLVAETVVDLLDHEEVFRNNDV